MITYRGTERTPTDKKSQESIPFITDGVVRDWWKKILHHHHETNGVVRDWLKKYHTTITR